LRKIQALQTSYTTVEPVSFINDNNTMVNAIEILSSLIGTGIDIFNIWSSDAGWLDKILSVIEKLDTRIDKTIGWNENLSCKSEIQSCLSCYYGFASSVSKSCTNNCSMCCSAAKL